MSEGLEAAANVTQILSLFIAVIALTLQGIDSYLKFKPHLAPTLQRLQYELKLYLPWIRFAATASIFFYFGSCAATPTTRIVVDLQSTNTALNQTITSISSTNSEPQVQANAPTASSVNSTVDPVNTVTLPTSTPQPLTVVFFSDNFDQGLKPDWLVLGGDWLVIEERLTPVRYEFGSPAQISVGDQNWTNYDIELEVGGLTTEYEGINNLTFRPRYQDRNNSPYFAIGGRQAVCGVRRDGRDSPLPAVEYNSASARIKINTIDNKFELFVNDRKICSFRDNNFQYGGLLIESRQFQNVTPWVDDLVVKIPARQ